MKATKTSILLIIIIVTIPIFCIPNTISNSDTNATIMQPKDRKITNLQNQIIEIKTYNSQLLATVRWTIGIVVMVLIVLVGYNWYSNYKMLEKEKNIIKDQLKNFIDEKMNDFTQKTEKRINSIINLRLDGLHNEIKKLNEIVYDLEMTNEEKEADDRKFVFLYCKPLKHAIKKKWNYKISDILEKIKELLNEKSILHVDDTSDINGVLELLPPKYKTEKSAIENMMSKIQEKNYD